MKYVIDVPNNMIIKSALNGLTLGIPMLVSSTQKEFVIPTNLQLNPYIEPDRKAIEDEVWEFARKMISTSGNEVSEMWGCVTNFGEVMHNTTYSEAKAKYEAWLKQKNEIKVGDEVTYTLCGDTVTFIVLGKKKNKYYGFNPNAPDYDDVGEYCDADMLKKTGRHFPEIVELLKKMRSDKE